MAKTNEEHHSSTENHELLVQLSNQMRSYDAKFERHLEIFGENNAAIGKRFDDTWNKFQTAITEIKDSLASRGRVSSGFIFGLVAIILSLVATLGGAVSAYMNVRIGNLMPLIDNNRDGVRAAEEQRLGMLRQITEFERDAVKIDATGAESRRWIEKSIDIFNTRLDSLEDKP